MARLPPPHLSFAAHLYALAALRSADLPRHLPAHTAPRCSAARRTSSWLINASSFELCGHDGARWRHSAPRAS